MRVFALIMLGVGGLLLAIAGYLFFRGQYLERNGELVTGTVTDFSVSTDADDNSESYCPQVRYTTKAGQTLTYDSNFCSSPPAYDVGQKVELYYDPKKPEDVQMKGFWVQYLTIVILGCIGLPILAFGAGSMFRSFFKGAAKT
jgi:hypothetical protein